MYRGPRRYKQLDDGRMESKRLAILVSFSKATYRRFPGNSELMIYDRPVINKFLWRQQNVKTTL